LARDRLYQDKYKSLMMSRLTDSTINVQIKLTYFCIKLYFLFFKNIYLKNIY
jgi:hypothetical protein